MSQIGEPQRIIIVEPVFEPVPVREEPANEPVRIEPEGFPEEIPRDT